LFSEKSKLLGGLLANGSFFSTFGLEDRIEKLDFIFLERPELVLELERLCRRMSVLETLGNRLVENGTDLFESFLFGSYRRQPT